MNEASFKKKEAVIPAEYADRFGYGLYGGIVQYYIKGVDGTIAQLGYSFPPIDQLDVVYDHAKEQHVALMGGIG